MVSRVLSVSPACFPLHLLHFSHVMKVLPPTVHHLRREAGCLLGSDAENSWSGHLQHRVQEMGIGGNGENMTITGSSLSFLQT